MMLYNQVAIAAKIAGAYTVREVSEGKHTITKVQIAIAQNKNVKGTWEHQHAEITAEAWNKTGEKIQKLSIGQRAVFMGRLGFDTYEHEGNKRTKWIIDVRDIEPIDSPSRAADPKPATPPPAPKPAPRDPEPDEPVTEDDLPF
jgi:single-stranded DNA-binding protein